MKMRRLIIAILCFAGCTANRDRGWQAVDTGPFIFDLPRGYRKLAVRGFDSGVGDYDCGDFSVGFDFGPYYNDFLDWPQMPEYENVVVDGKLGRIGTAEVQSVPGFRFTTQLLIRDVLPPMHFGEEIVQTHLTVTAVCKTRLACDEAKRVFLSIRMKSLDEIIREGDVAGKRSLEK